MRTTLLRPAAVTLGVAAGAAALTLGGPSTAASSGPAGATDPADSTAISLPAEPAAPADETPTERTSTERQQGLVLECAGDGVRLDVYENQRYGNTLVVFLGDPDDGLAGSLEQTAPFVVDGGLAVDVDVDGRTAHVVGTVTETGRPERLVEPVQDNGEQIVSRGTHTQLATDLVVVLDDVSTPVDCSPAFAFDLQVRTTTLG